MSFVSNIYERFGWTLRDLYRQKPEMRPMPASDFNRFLAEVIRCETPTAVARLGVSEADAVLNHLEITAIEKRRRNFLAGCHLRWQGARPDWAERTVDLLCNNAGFFPPESWALARFATEFLNGFACADLCGVWGFVPGEQMLIRRCCPAAIQFEPTGLEPYYFDEPWSQELRGRRVLVIHPFAESIRRQYEKRHDLFADPDVLPPFHLMTVQAVQSLMGGASRFNDWFEALAFMKTQIDELDFDVALIGAGAYGVPLCAHVKKKGKTAIQIGGALQILFGIKGRRWDNMPSISKFYNEHWVRPSASEQIPSADKIEGGCYW